MLLKKNIINKTIFIMFFLSNCLYCNLNFCYSLLNNLKNICLDTFEINSNLFSLSTLHILSLSTPIYLFALDFDQKINYLFYNKIEHQNIRQFTDFNFKYNIELSDILLTNSIFLSSIGYFSNNQKFKTISYKLMLGLCCAGIVKKIIKLIKWNNSLRPNNQNFIKNQKYYGGFPSGHLMTMSYLSTIWINQLGIKKAFPIIAATSYIFIDYIVKNRHYISQLIAGSTLGIIYGCAVNSCLNTKINNNKLDKYLNRNIIKLDTFNKKLKLTYYF